MNRPVVIYSSHYGFTERYARWIARDLDCPIFPAKPFPVQSLRGLIPSFSAAAFMREEYPGSGSLSPTGKPFLPKR